MMAKRPLYPFQITYLGRRGVPLSTIMAHDVEDAIERYIRDYNVTDPERRRRLSAHRAPVPETQKKRPLTAAGANRRSGGARKRS